MEHGRDVVEDQGRDSRQVVARGASPTDPMGNR